MALLQELLTTFIKLIQQALMLILISLPKQIQPILLSRDLIHRNGQATLALATGLLQNIWALM